MIKKNSNELPYSLFKLPNGLRAVFWPVSGVEVVCIGVRIRAGSWYETNLKRGAFHFLEHALVQGSRKFPSFRILSQKQEDIGLRVYNGVSGEYSFFQWSLPKENFSKGLELLSEYVFHPLLPPDGVERERKIILQEYQDYWDSPYNRFSKAFSKDFWGEGHPYTLDPLGTEEGIMKITRDDLVKIHQKWYQPQNMVLVVVGDLEREYVEEKINKIFSAKHKTSFLPALSFPIPKFHKKTFLWQEDLKQVTFSLVFPTFGYREREKKERIILSMISYILIDSRWSRLNLRLREREPLAYSVWGSSSFYPQGGFLDINASFSPANTGKIIKIVGEEVKKIKTKGIEDREFKRAQRYFRYQLLMSFDTVYDIASNLISDLFREGRIFLPHDIIKEVNSIKKYDLERLAKEVFIYEKSAVGIMTESDFLKEDGTVDLLWESLSP